jgi:hypothetical protein
MKSTIVLATLLLSAPAFAQNGSTDPLKACGAKETTYSITSERTTSPMKAPQPGMAVVYFIEDDGSEGGPHYTIRVALDGSWVGAYKQNAYFAISVPAGEHHICANVQSGQSAGKIYAFAHFNAEPGKVYYFRTQFLGGIYPVPRLLGLDPIDSDEATYLISSFPQSTAAPSK